MLAHIIEQYPGCLQNRRQLKGLISDLIQDKREQNLLMMVYDDGIVDELNEKRYMTDLTRHRYIKRLMDNYGLTKESASKALESWIQVFQIDSDVSTCLEPGTSDADNMLTHSAELFIQTGIAGLRFYVKEDSEEGKKLMASLVAGTELQLVREPENEYDEWAIAVYTKNGKMLGHVSRYKNEPIARLMDQGEDFIAVVDDKNKLQHDERWKKAYTEDYTIPFSIYHVKK